VPRVCVCVCVCVYIYIWQWPSNDVSWGVAAFSTGPALTKSAQPPTAGLKQDTSQRTLTISPDVLPRPSRVLYVGSGAPAISNVMPQCSSRVLCIPAGREAQEISIDVQNRSSHVLYIGHRPITFSNGVQRLLSIVVYIEHGALKL
jgi:hypothetical protein